MTQHKAAYCHCAAFPRPLAVRVMGMGLSEISARMSQTLQIISLTHIESGKWAGNEQGNEGYRYWLKFILILVFRNALLEYGNDTLSARIIVTAFCF
jgi:hypothetical protein